MTLQEQRDIIQAAIDGKEIEWKAKTIHDDEWLAKNNTRFDFSGGILYRVKPDLETVPWDFEDYLEHADCWYKVVEDGRIARRITDFDLGDKEIYFSDSGNWQWIYKMDDTFEFSYCTTPNGEFKPCVKEVNE